MDLSALNQILSIVYTIAAIIAAVAATIGTTVSIMNRIISRRAAASAKDAATASAATSVSVDAMKKRTDDLFTAFLRDQSQELRLRRIEQYLAEHEAAKRADHVAPESLTEGAPDGY